MPGSCEAVRALVGAEAGAGAAGAAGAGARSQWAMQLRVVRGGKDRQSELQPEANVAEICGSGASSKGISNLERPSAMILAGLHMGGDSGF